MDLFTRFAEPLAAFSRFSQALGGRADYVQGGGGNTSIKLDERLIAVKASGFPLRDITPQNAYVVLDYQALRAFYEGNNASNFEDVEAAGSAAARETMMAVEGLKPLRPSVEAGFHALLDRFVGHTHSVYANLAACCRETEAILKEALAGADYGYAVVPYVNPGTTLTFTIRDILASAGRPRVLVMQNHGVIVHDDDEARCLAIHEDMNRRLAEHFVLAPDAFPACRVKAAGEGFVSDTPWLAQRLKGDVYPDSLLLDAPLYPDQMVFFQGALGETALIDRETGLVRYALPEASAQTLEETLTAVIFIMGTIAARGYTLQTMGEAAQRFIGSWESEKYRKKLSEGKA
ncbi:MAG: class II aldolase/adducin family protein [Christensenellales bacterium]|jgi:ribulose-5-phosphate 4-epimerase/fuculose-1-phosphate aldolase